MFWKKKGDTIEFANPTYPRYRVCEVCGFGFVPTKQEGYIATDRSAVFQALTTPAKQYDATDCPKCGCQIILAERLPKVSSRASDDEGSGDA